MPHEFRFVPPTVVNGEKRTRKPRRCDTCRHKKIQCDFVLPQCDWCRHHNLSCTSNGVPRCDGTTRRDMSAPGAVAARASQQLPFAPLPPFNSAGQFCGFDGLFLFSEKGRQWIRSRTGHDFMLESVATSIPQGLPTEALSPSTLLTSSHPISWLPPRWVVEQSLDQYRSSGFLFIYPVLSPPIFEQTIDCAYRNFNDIRNAQAVACIGAYLAFASVCDICKGLESLVDGHACAKQVEALVPCLLHMAPSLDGLQALIMLLIFKIASADNRFAEYLPALIASHILRLNGHVLPFDDPSLEATEENGHVLVIHRHLRNLFWLFYSLEKDLCFNRGYHPVLHDENLDLTLPEGYLDYLYKDDVFPGLPATLPPGPVFPLDLRLSIIKSHAFRMLYSYSGLQKTDVDLLQSVRTLDDELENWRISVPIEWRPSVSFLRQSAVPTRMSMRVVMLRLNYHQCMAAIHIASSRCQAWKERNDQVIAGVASSLALAVEASRSTLYYLQVADQLLLNHTFWVVVSYPIASLLNVFCDILERPLSDEASSSLELLASAPPLLQKLYRFQDPPNGDPGLMQLMQLSTELHRLGKHAIEYAKARPGLQTQ